MSNTRSHRYTDPTTQVDDPQELLREVKQALETILAQQGTNEQLTRDVADLFRSFIGHLENNQSAMTPQRAGEARARFIRRMYPLIERNALLTNPAERLNIPIMRTIHLPIRAPAGWNGVSSPSIGFGAASSTTSSSSHTPPTPTIPTGGRMAIDTWMNLRIDRYSRANIHRLLNQIRPTLENMPDSFKINKGYHAVLKKHLDITQRTSALSVSDEIARALFAELRGMMRASGGVWRTPGTGGSNPRSSGSSPLSSPLSIRSKSRSGGFGEPSTPTPRNDPRSGGPGQHSSSLSIRSGPPSGGSREPSTPTPRGGPRSRHSGRGSTSSPWREPTPPESESPKLSRHPDPKSLSDAEESVRRQLFKQPPSHQEQVSQGKPVTLARRKAKQESEQEEEEGEEEEDSDDEIEEEDDDDDEWKP